MNNLAALVFLMFLPLFFGVMAVFLVQFFQMFISSFSDLFDDKDDKRSIR